MLAEFTFYVDTTIESPENICDSAVVQDLNEVKVEPEEFNVHQSKVNEVTSNNSELPQRLDESPECRTGKFYSAA